MNKRWTTTLLTGIAAAGLAVGATVAVSGSAGATSASSTPAPGGSTIVNKTITVSGEGTISVKPDLATVWLGARAQAAKASEALDTVNQKTAALIDALKKAGVSEDDITTSGLSVYPETDRDNRVTSFNAANGVVVKVRDITKTGPVVDAAVAAAGENVTVGGIYFSIDDPEKVIAEARKNAIDNAKKRAGEYAAAAGVTVGEVIQISELSVNVPAPMVMERQDKSMDAPTASAAPTPVSVGTQDLRVNVNVVFAIG